MTPEYHAYLGGPVDKRAFILAAIVGAAVVTACGRPPVVNATAASPSASPRPTAVAGGCPAGRPVVSGQVLTIDIGDYGKSFCVQPGALIFVVLPGTPGREWSPIRSSSSVLAPHPDGHLTLIAGETAASFVAVRPGSAALTSARGVCAGALPGGSSPTPALSSSAAGCDTILLFRTAVIVRG